MTRRRAFVRGIALASAGVGCGGGGSGGGSPTGPLAPPPTEPLILRMPLMAIGETVALFIEDEITLAVTRQSATAVVAVSRICTHQGCTVFLPSRPGQTLDCPCHGSRFTTSGAVVNGPAARPLPRYAARIEEAEVVITVI